jgi:hypothetical protein
MESTHLHKRSLPKDSDFEKKNLHTIFKTLPGTEKKYTKRKYAPLSKWCGEI